MIIRASILDEEASRVLFEANPITWLRGAIGVDTQRGASEITDRELLAKYVEGGRFEWNPYVAKSVGSYLKNQGFSWVF